MKNFIKVHLFTFIFLSIITLLVNILKYQSKENLYLTLIAIAFNILIALIFISITGALFTKIKKEFIYYIFCFITAIIIGWYLLSSLLFLLYGSFISRTGAYFYLASLNLGSRLLLIFIFISILIYIGKKLSHYSRKNQLIKAKKFIPVLIISLLFFTSLMIALPKQQLHEISPIADFFANFRSTLVDEYNQVTKDNSPSDPILNVSIDLEKPNVILIVIDSLSASHLGYSGYERNITPNIDWFAKNSIVFTKAYSLASHSDYAQPSLLASRYPLISAERTLFRTDYAKDFIWDMFKKQNYSTAYISSQDDEWIGIIDFLNTTNLDYYSYSLTDNSYNYGRGLAKKDYDEVTVDKALPWMNNTEPFFLYLNFQAPHEPYQYPESAAKFLPDRVSIYTNYLHIAEGDLEPSINRYDNSVAYTDFAIGKLKDELIKTNKLNHTIVIITADHGDTVLEKHNHTRHGYGVYDEEVNVPLLIYIPNRQQEIIQERVTHLDLAPTILNLLKFSTSTSFQGRAMSENTNLFFVTQSQNFIAGVIKNNIKYIYNFKKDTAEVYNLTSDPKELKNLINETNKKYFNDNYGSVLFSWYNCQIDYYSNKKYKTNEIINC